MSFFLTEGTTQQWITSITVLEIVLARVVLHATDHLVAKTSPNNSYPVNHEAAAEVVQLVFESRSIQTKFLFYPTLFIIHVSL